MRIAACYKCVPNSEMIEARADGGLELGQADLEIGLYDLRAIEEAARLATALGGEVVAVTAGSEIVENSKMKKAVLSRGPSCIYALKDDGLEGADSYATASALKALIENIGGADVIICGEGSSDLYSQQVGNILGSMMGVNTLNSVSKITPDGDSFMVERSVEDGVESYRVTAPMLLSVTPDINTPRIPSMKDILAAGKKPLTVLRCAQTGFEPLAASINEGIVAPKAAERQLKIFDASIDGDVEAFAECIRDAI